MEDRKLRADFRRALEAVSPAAPWLSSSVRSALRERRHEGWLQRTRRQPARMRFAMTGLTMAVIAILVAGALVLAHLYLMVPRPQPGGHGSSSALAQLEARPLHLPQLNADGSCPPDQSNPSTGLYGSGPVYLHGGSYTGTPWGDFYDVGAYTPPNMTGPVLLRARDLIAPNHPVVFVGPYATGTVVATDPIFGKLYSELVLDTSHAPNVSANVNGAYYTSWYWRQGIAAGWTGCVAFQLDGMGFSSEIAISNQPLKNGRDTGYTGG